MERIAASVTFRKAERCLRLLRYLTDRTQEGRTGELKEYALAVSVFERADSFDPRTDPVVRLEARRLRLKLAEYYQQEGLDDAVVIELPKGAYIPHFRSRAEPIPIPIIPVVAVKNRTPTRWLVSAAALLAVSLGVWYAIAARADRFPVRPSIAVLGFQNLSSRPESSWMNAAISELMDIELSAGQQLRTSPALDVARMDSELAIAPHATYEASLLQRIGRDLGVDYAVAGNYLPQDGHIKVDLALFDIRSGRQIAAFTEETTADKLLPLAQDCAARIRSRLGIRLSTVRGLSSYPPAEPLAMESYARGMERLRQSDALGARPLLEHAASIAPGNALVHSGLAAAWSMLGFDDRARQEAKEAFDASSGLGRVEQLEIEGRYREMDHDWPAAIRVYQALFTLFPDDLEYGLLLARVQTQGTKAQDALATVGAARKLPHPLSDDPRVDLAEAQSAGALADYAHARRAAHAAAEKAAQRGARLQYARARLLESGAMQNLHAAGFAELRAEARRICIELGDQICAASAYRIEANSLATTGSPAAARPLYQAVLDISNQTGNLNEKLNALSGLAYTEQVQGDLKSAENDDRAAMEVASRFGVQKRAQTCIDLAGVLAAEGRVADARTLGEEALEIARQSHDQESLGTSEHLLAHLLALEGKFAESMELYQEAIRVLREVNEPMELCSVLLEIGGDQLAHGDLGPASRNFEEARDLDRRYEGFARPLVDLAFARLALAGGKPQEAAGLARSAMNTFAANGREGDRLEAAALLVRALMALGKPAEASAVITSIAAPDGKPFPIESIVRFRIARCLTLASSGHRSEASQGIDKIAADVSRLRLPVLEDEARNARAEVTACCEAPHSTWSR